MMTDPVADMLTRIRNAGRARHAETRCPASRLKAAVAKVLADKGFVDQVKEDASGRHPELVIGIRYRPDGRTLIDGVQKVSRPGRRVFVSAAEVPRVRNGLGMAVLSTSRGVMSDADAREAHIGGEVICEVW